jgi:undecaprenyl-diphosphatase
VRSIAARGYGTIERVVLLPISLARTHAPKWSAIVAIGGATAFLALALLVALGATRALDLATTLAFQSVASDALDELVNWHTLLGQLLVTLPAAALIALVTWRRLGGYAWVAPLFILATGGIELVFKFALQHPGPPDDLVRAFMNPLGIRVTAPSSFPSGHLARLTFLAIVLAGLFPSRLAWAAAIAFIGVTLFARVYIGDHWISDALAGLALGAAVAAAAVAWMRATSAGALRAVTRGPSAPASSATGPEASRGPTSAR